MVLKFIQHFPKGNNKVVLMNTRGGLKIGNIITPGLSGASFLWTSLVLRKKGYKIAGQIPFDMPSNWISIHPALTGKAVKFIDEKNYKKVEKHAGIILSEQPDFLAHRDLIQDILLLPVSLAWYLGGRFFFAKSYYASNACDNCGTCEKECPVHAIKNSDRAPFWTFRCESCMRCMNICPKQAIETTHGLWVMLIMAGFLLSGLSCRIVNLSNHTGLVKFLFFNVILFVLLFVFYRLQHVLLKNKLIRKLISFTSLTHYKFWGRYLSKKVT
jgi:Pyruvate/2-oxoacid:ferredoxin oxidoreductase delta subunit